MILIPVKNLSSAKQRLASLFDQAARTQLAQAMLHDVVAALASWPGRPACALVTNDHFAIELSEQYDFQIIPDPINPGETGAIEMATAICCERGARFTLVIPGDIPLAQGSEIEKIFAQAPKEGSVLVPAYDGHGTNAAYRAPADLFPLRFGNDSFQPHLAAARATGKDCAVLQFAGIGLDVDNPADLQELMSRPGETRTQRLLRRWRLDAQALALDSKCP